MRNMMLAPATLALTALLTAPLAATPLGGDVGDRLPVEAEELEDFALTEAGSFDEFFGRTVLIEAFAYW